MQRLFLHEVDFSLTIMTMRTQSAVLLVLCTVVVIQGCSLSKGTTDTSLVIGTFNIEWLGDGNSDRKPRTDNDYLMMADIIIKSEADVLGVQEIENENALKKVLRYLDDYDGFVSQGGGQQRVGIVYKKSVDVQRIGDYTPLALGKPQRLRPGLVVACRKGKFDWIQMIVHLKSTSRYDSTAEMVEESRSLRTRQSEIIRAWADSVTSGPEKDVIITGDLNDYPHRQLNPTLSSLANASNLLFLSRNLKSCANSSWNVIDHIVVSVTASQRYRSGSEYVENIHDFLTEADAEKVSDHCPVLARFEIITADTD